MATSRSDHIVMDRLESVVADWDREAPIVLYCRSGGRSDRAAMLLERAGFRHCASMKGGVLKWAELGFPLGGGTQGLGGQTSPPDWRRRVGCRLIAGR